MELKAVIFLSILVNCTFGASISSKDSFFNERNPLDVDDADLEVIVRKVKFYLYTKEYNNDYELRMDSASLENSTFNIYRPTKIAIHGYEHDYKTEACQLIRYAYLNSSQDVNVICVEWGKLCMGPPFGFYVEAVWNVPKVGAYLGQFIDFLVKNGSADVTSFHLIGHSLGAHLAAFAANTVTSGNITRISGLDPALPLYGFFPLNRRLDPSDAEVVDVIHTCGGFQGFYKPLGTVDFYPNGGRPVQPGCGFDYDKGCSHASVVRYYASSVHYPFTSKYCDTFLDVKYATCKGSLGYMGDPAIITPDGIYYLETSATYPYSMDIGS